MTDYLLMADGYELLTADDEYIELQDVILDYYLIGVADPMEMIPTAENVEVVIGGMAGYLLKADGDYILQQVGDKIIFRDPVQEEVHYIGTVVSDEIMPTAE